MPSRSLVTWRIDAARALDEIEGAHRAVGGTGRGRRFATQQINQAYAVLLSSQFQWFCRDLHSEAVDELAGAITIPMIRHVFRTQCVAGRKLDFGNPNPGNIGSDFGRFTMDFWPLVMNSDSRNPRRRASLEALNRWRNAIAHQDFKTVLTQGISELGLREVRQWRTACDAFAHEFDRVVAAHVDTILSRPSK